MPATSLIGQILNERYQIDRLIGEGGMGAVYEAHHVLLPKRVAIKTLRAEFSDDEKFRARFLREARATSRIEHPNIVGVSDVGVHEERLVYFVLEYLEGEDLSKTLEREYRLPWPRVQRIGLELCAALAAAHAARVIHRDLKPSNCFRVATLDDEDRIKILDFGIAKLVEDTSGRRRSGRSVNVEAVNRRLVRLTETGEIFGTMAYMSPEHLRGEEVGYQTDIYAVGVILFELLTGRTPFLTSNPISFMHSIELEAPEPPSRYAPDMEIPADLDYKILQALQKRPQDRYASMLEFQRALESIHPDLPLASPPPAAPADGDGDSERRQADPDVASRGTFDDDGPTRILVRTAGGLPVVPARRRQVGLAVGALTIAAVAFGVGAWATKSAVRTDWDEVQSDSVDARTEAIPERDGVAVEESGNSTAELQPEVPPGPMVTRPDPVPALVEASGSQPGRPPGSTKENLASWDPQPTRPPPAGTRLCNLDPYDRNQMFTPHREAVRNRCRQDVPPNVPVTVQVQVVRGKLLVSPHPNLTGKLRDVGTCIAKYLKAKVTVPGRFKTCRTPKVLQGY